MGRHSETLGRIEGGRASVDEGRREGGIVETVGRETRIRWHAKRRVLWEAHVWRHPKTGVGRHSEARVGRHSESLRSKGLLIEIVVLAEIEGI